jgi:glutathione synthase/RimK-type ligase-like ATP-grasp enzyme
MKKPTILLTGCGGIPTQNVVKSLRHERDCYRLVGVECDPHRVFLTEGFDKKYVVPKASAPNYVSFLNDIIATEQVDFLHAQPDAEVSILSAMREGIQTRLMLPARDEVELCHNKFALMQRLRETGIHTAHSMLISCEADLAMAMETLGPKVWLRAIHGAGGRGSLPVDHIDHARMWVDYWDGWGTFAAEEYLPGKNLAWQGVYLDGQLVGSIAWERIEYIIPQSSPSGVTGTPGIAKLLNDDVVHRVGRQAVEAVGPRPNGVYGVDMKENDAGIPFVTEINPGRFFQPSFMYAAGGYNLVQYFFDLVLGRVCPGEFDIRASVPADFFWLRGIDVPPMARQINQLPEPGEPCE